MNNAFKQLRLAQMDKRFEAWRTGQPIEPPKGGWLRAIREALGMSLTQLGSRLGLTRQAVSGIERREADGSITLETLRRAADALNADVVYTVVPRSPLADMRLEQARIKATENLERVAHSMRLEAQGVRPSSQSHQIEERARELADSWSRSIWSPSRSSK